MVDSRQSKDLKSKDKNIKFIEERLGDYLGQQNFLNKNVKLGIKRKKINKSGYIKINFLMKGTMCQVNEWLIEWGNIFVTPKIN